MSVKDTVRRQYLRLVNQVAYQVDAVQQLKEGWIATLRQALAMPGAQLAKRVGVTRAAIYQAERNERNGAITLKQMEKIAQGLGGKFVYAIVPEGSVEHLIRQQAQTKAEALVRRASGHMALEKQSLPAEETHREIDRLTEEMIRNMPSDFWDKC
jgi:predicted DNA-binding mobile mystery protein A